MRADDGLTDASLRTKFAKHFEAAVEHELIITRKVGTETPVWLPERNTGRRTVLQWVASGELRPEHVIRARSRWQRQSNGLALVA